MKTLILIKIIYKITNKHKIVFSYTIAGTRFDNFGFLTILDKKIRNLHYDGSNNTGPNIHQSPCIINLWFSYSLLIHTINYNFDRGI